MNRYWLGFLALCCADAAVAQDPGFSVSVGARAWYTEWTTFSYFVDDTTDPDTNLALTQLSASNEASLHTPVSVRYRDFVGSVSGWPSTKFSFDDGSSKATREEFDINVGYYVMSRRCVDAWLQEGTAERMAPTVTGRPARWSALAPTRRCRARGPCTRYLGPRLAENAG